MDRAARRQEGPGEIVGHGQGTMPAGLIHDNHCVSHWGDRRGEFVEHGLHRRRRYRFLARRADRTEQIKRFMSEVARTSRSNTLFVPTTAGSAGLTDAGGILEPHLDLSGSVEAAVRSLDQGGSARFDRGAFRRDLGALHHHRLSQALGLYPAAADEAGDRATRSRDPTMAEDGLSEDQETRQKTKVR